MLLCNVTLILWCYQEMLYYQMLPGNAARSSLVLQVVPNDVMLLMIREGINTNIVLL